MLPSSGGRMGNLPVMLPFMLPWRKTNVTIVWGWCEDVTNYVTITVVWGRMGMLHATIDVTIRVTMHVTIHKHQCYHRLGGGW